MPPLAALVFSLFAAALLIRETASNLEHGPPQGGLFCGRLPGRPFLWPRIRPYRRAAGAAAGGRLPEWCAARTCALARPGRAFLLSDGQNGSLPWGVGVRRGGR